MRQKSTIRNNIVNNRNMWRLNIMPLNNQWITEKIKEIKKYLVTHDNENTTVQNLWDTTKPVLRGKFIARQSYIRKQEKFQIKNLILHLKQVEKRKNLKLSE